MFPKLTGALRFFGATYFSDTLLTIPLAVIDDRGKFSVVFTPMQPAQDTFVVPRALAENLSLQLIKGWASKAWLNPSPKLGEWAGAESVFGEGMTFSVRSDSFESLNAAQHLQKGWLGATSELRSVRFLSPGRKNDFPLIQEVWCKKASRGKKLGRIGFVENQSSTAEFANVAIRRLRPSYRVPKFVEFSSPFDAFFTAGWLYLNILHPTGAALANCIQAISDRESSGFLHSSFFSDNMAGKIKDVLRLVFPENTYSSGGYFYEEDLEPRLQAIEKLFQLAEQLEVFTVDHEILWAHATTNIPATVKTGRFGEQIRELSDVGL